MRHDCDVSAQVGGTTPPVQVPLVEPAGMSQVSPAQQSAVWVHVPSAGMHETQCVPSHLPPQQFALVVQVAPSFAQGEPQAPPLHAPKQQGVEPLQVWPSRAQGPIAVAQAQPTSGMSWHVVPSQQDGVPPTEQVAPCGRQEFGAQRGIPCASFTHGALPQH